MNIVVTGASGYLGSRLVKAISECHDVISLVRKTSSLDRIREIDTTVRFVEELKSVFDERSVDVVVNTAALYGRNKENLSELIEANLLFPQKLFQEAKKSGVKLFINIGTSLPSCVSFYAKTKNLFSELLESQQDEEIKIIDLNLEHFYGFGDDKTKFTTYIFDSCIKGLDLDLTLGTQRRDFVHVDDVVNAIEVLLKNRESLKHWESIDVGSGQAPTIREFVETVKRVFRSSSLLNFGAKSCRINEVQLSRADTKRLHELGWLRTYDLEAGLKNIFERYEL